MNKKKKARLDDRRKFKLLLKFMHLFWSYLGHIFTQLKGHHSSMQVSEKQVREEARDTTPSVFF